MNTYFIRLNGEQLGPLSTDELKKLDLARETPAWTEGMEDWSTAGAIDDLKFLFIAMPPPFIDVMKVDEEQPPVNIELESNPEKPNTEKPIEEKKEIPLNENKTIIDKPEQEHTEKQPKVEEPKADKKEEPLKDAEQKETKVEPEVKENKLKQLTPKPKKSRFFKRLVKIVGITVIIVGLGFFLFNQFASDEVKKAFYETVGVDNPAFVDNTVYIEVTGSCNQGFRRSKWICAGTIWSTHPDKSFSKVTIRFHFTDGYDDEVFYKTLSSNSSRKKAWSRTITGHKNASFKKIEVIDVQ